ncbi:CDP-glycerol glycerophosphotransferase family protein [Vibrio chagasii]|uniref:CDP-glycerol glycerophosphotransferase family protein n=1 Tax=Vibrio chagasii TaxID=170679 RepID=UPI001640032F|nr:CDP-glycerol glycerophosphotransferase family protein [Vibrio chagasii]
MNKDKFNFGRALNLVMGFFPSLFWIFGPRKENRIIISSEFNSKFNHNSKHIFLYFTGDCFKNDFEIKFVVNDKSLREELIKSYGDYFISSFNIRDVLFILTAKNWITSSLETPIGGIFLAFRRNVIHLGHGAPIKKIGLNENYNNWKKRIYYGLIKFNFSHFFSTSPEFSENWARCLGINQDKVVISPQARNSVLELPLQYNDSLKIRGKYNVLYAPTWRVNSRVEIFPFEDLDLAAMNDFLCSKGIVIYIRLHPNFEDLIQSNFASYSNIIVLSRNDIEDVAIILNQFDLMITDYSSIYVDFLLTLKPLLFIPYDYDDYDKKVGFAIDYYTNSPGPKPKSQACFLSNMERLLLDKEYYLLERIEVNNRLNTMQSAHSEKCAQAILSLIC